MAFTTFKELNQLNDEMLANAILDAKKQLFELRLQRATRQSFKSHLFKHLKRKVAQLLTIETTRKINSQIEKDKLCLLKKDTEPL